MASLKLLLFIFALITGAILLSGCLQGPAGPQGPKGDPGDAGTAGALIQGPNRVMLYTPYTLLDPATGMNGTIIANGFNLTSTYMTNNTGYKPDYPRNIMVNGTNISNTITVYITGYDTFDNSARTETLVLSSTVWQVNGSRAWYNVTNISWSGGGAYDFVSAGWGWKFGIPGLVKAKSDIMGVTVAGTGKTVDGQTWDFTNNTVQFDTAPNAARDYVVQYRQYGVAPP